MDWSSKRYLKIFWLKKDIEHIVRLHYQSAGSAPDENINSNKMEEKQL